VANDQTAKERDAVGRIMGVLDDVLDTLHDRVIRPLLIAGRFVAYGFILLIVAIVFLTALLLGAFRLLDVYAFHAHVWISYYIIGAVSTLGGMLFWRKRHPVAVREKRD
jgi:hypothetical protein